MSNIKRKRGRLKILSLFLLILIILFGIKLFQVTVSSAALKEFKGSYPEEISINGTVKEFNLIADEAKISISDSKNLKVWSYNSQVPGPELRVKLGDTVKINFTNNLIQETTIHFHGIRVPNAMDGVPGVTQESIKPGESFVYEFAPKDAGTFWYHPHVRSSEQVERGLYGAIIVEDQNEPIYDQDKVIILDDWRLDQFGQIDPYFNTGHDLSHDGRWGDTITVNGKSNFKLSVKSGQRLRLRFINTSNARVYQLDFGDLSAKGFAVDGMKAKETFEADGFLLAPGNRIDVDIAIPMVSRNKPYQIKDNFTQQSIKLMEIEVEESLSEYNNFETPIAKHFPEWKNEVQKIDEEYVIDARRGGGYGIEWTINGKAYPDYDPVKLKKGTFNKIRITNDSFRIHPMHIHGQFFKVLSKNGYLIDEPFWRDTVLIEPKESIDIGLVPLDKGEWVSHCHTLEHAEAGMMTVVSVN